MSRALLVGAMSVMTISSMMMAQRTDGPHLEITVLRNAGEQDAEWVVSGQEDAIRQIRALMIGLPQVEKPQDDPALGWRGFLILNRDVASLPREFRVLKGVVRVNENGKSTYFRDTHGLESWLRDQARRHGINL